MTTDQMPSAPNPTEKAADTSYAPTEATEAFRNQCAVAAMTALLGHVQYHHILAGNVPPEWEAVARMAFQVADEMVKKMHKDVPRDVSHGYMMYQSKERTDY